MGQKINSIKYILWIGSLVPIGLVIVLSIISLNQFSQFEDNNKWVQHTNEVLISASKIEKLKLDLETGQRGFIITGKESFLEPFYAGKEKVFKEIRLLKKKVRDNPAQVIRLNDIDRHIYEWIETAGKPEIEARRKFDKGELPFETVVQMLITENGKKQIDRLRYILKEFISVENKLMDMRKQKLSDRINTTKAIEFIGILLIITIIITVGYFSSKIILAQDKLKSIQANLVTELQKNTSLEIFSDKLLNRLATVTSAKLSACYIATSTRGNGEKQLRRYGSYGSYGSHESKNPTGLVQQCFVDGNLIKVSDIPEEYFQIHSSLGRAKPKEILLVPIKYKGGTISVIELASFSPFSKDSIKLLSSLTEPLSIIINNAVSQIQTESLLKETQLQSTKLQKQQVELQKANHKAELANKAKSEFLANMSHELRTPLNSLLILSQLMAENDEGNLTEEQITNMTIIYDGGLSLLHLINDILDLSKVEAGKMNINYHKFTMGDFILSIQSMFEPISQEKNIAFNIQQSEEFPNEITSDRMRLEQIIRNLLSNAFKFTQEGSVTLNLKINDSSLIFSIADTGIGIDPDKQKSIFDPFQQADGSTTRKYGGTGLGLSISQALSTLLGGKLSLESKEGEGSIFTLSLPKKAKEAQKNSSSDIIMTHKPSNSAEKAEKKDSHDLKGKHILIVDDDLKNSISLSKVLKRHGIELSIADNGRFALEKLKNAKNIDLVLMDMMMPIMDGYETMKKIRAQEQYKNLPIIALSAKAMVEDRAKCIEAGASDYLAKPTDIKELISIIKSHLNKDFKV